MKFISNWDVVFFSQLKHLNLPLCFPDRKLTLFKSVLGSYTQSTASSFTRSSKLLHATLQSLKPDLYIHSLHLDLSGFLHRVKLPASQMIGFAAMCFPILLSNLPEQWKKQKKPCQPTLVEVFKSSGGLRALL